MKVSKFDKPTMRMLRSEIDTALKALGEKYGITLNAGNGGLTDTHAHFKLNMSLTDGSGKAVPEYATNFPKYCMFYGLEASDLGKKIVSNGNEYKVVGINPKKKKYPIVGERIVGGGIYIFPADAVARQLHPVASKPGLVKVEQ